MRNQFFGWPVGAPSAAAFDPVERARTSGTDEGYFAGVLAEVDRLLGGRGLTFLLTWNLDAFEERFRGAVVLLIGDERYQVPSYASAVRAVFKTGGTSPNPLGTTLRLPPAIAWRELVRGARNRAVSAGRWVRHGRGGGRVFEIPIGYFHQVEVPWVPFAGRGVDVSFAGAVPGAGRWSVRPSAAARGAMWRAMGRAAEAMPGLRFERFSSDTALGPEAYSRLLMDTKVVLCPRGNFDETFRVVEAARAGCVAVAEALPGRWYNRAAPVVPITDWRRLPEVLGRMFEDPAGLARRSEAMAGWWREGLSEAAVGRYVAERVAEVL